MKSDIKVSIIVPVYNTANFLSKCVDSLLAQTLQDIEIILVVDKSKDNSEEICMDYEKRYPDKIKTIQPVIKKRQGDARNLGIEAAKGEYLAFVDSDDWIELEMYQLLYEQAKRERSELCYCYRNQIDEKGKISKDSHPYFYPTGLLTDAKTGDIIAKNNTFIQKAIYKRSIFIEYGIRFPENVRTEDIIIDPLFVLYTSHISSVKKTLYHYFIHLKSTMNTVDEKKPSERLKVAQLIIEEYKKRGFYEKYRDEVNYLFFRKGYVHTAISYILNTASPRRKDISEIKQHMLDIDKNYRKNPYYKQQKSFLLIDRMLCNILLIKVLKIILKIKKYNI